MRKNFYQILEEAGFDYAEEYRRLLHLFEVEKSIPYGYYSYTTLSEYIDRKYFRSLPFRGSCTCIQEMRETIKLYEVAYSIDDLYLLCEFLIGILPYHEISKDRDVLHFCDVIQGNINSILEKTNHELKMGSNGRKIIIEKNKVTNLAVEIVEDKSIAIDLIEYNHYANKRNLDQKKKLLVAIGLYIEPILKSRALSKAGYSQLESDVGFVFNNFHIRHNNKEGVKAQEYILQLSNKQLEEWYDRAYQLALTVIIVNDSISTYDSIKALKSQYNWKT